MLALWYHKLFPIGGNIRSSLVSIIDKMHE
jgi:hypothetical protein